MANFLSTTLLSVLLIVSSVAFTAHAYPRRPTNGQFQTNVGLPAMAATYTGTCASIGYTTRCCPPDEDCTAADNIAGTEACYCSSDCYIYEDCCSDIVNVCPENPRSCAELGFVDRCCEDPMSMGFCKIETDSSSCSCKKSCFIEKNCCPEIGCSPTNCAEAGLNAGCCTGSCNVTYGANRSETCYCDDRCRRNGDCCEDVNQTEECNPSCTLTIMNPQTKTQEERPKLSPLQLAARYQKRLKNFMARSQVSVRQSSTQRAYVDERNNMREKIATMLDSRRARMQNNKRS